MRQLIPIAAPMVRDHFRMKSAHLGLLQRLNTTAEEWFRIELLGVFASLPGVEVTGTNQRRGESRERPDFSLVHDGRDVSIELKVLPQDRNYPYGWQRFLAGRNNRKDFLHTQSGARSGVIYIYWPDPVDWRRCSDSIAESYGVDCIQEDTVETSQAPVVISYWARRSACAA
jgi:hypothetical protein